MSSGPRLYDFVTARRVSCDCVSTAFAARGGARAARVVEDAAGPRVRGACARDVARLAHARVGLLRLLGGAQSARAGLVRAARDARRAAALFPLVSHFPRSSLQVLSGLASASPEG